MFKKLVTVFALLLITTVSTGCNMKNDQLTLDNKKLLDDNSHLQKTIEDLRQQTKNLEGYLNQKTEQNDELQSQLKNLNGFTIEHENQIIIDSRIELEALSVILSHFAAANEQNEEQFKKTIVNSDNSSLMQIWDRAKEGKKVVLKRVEFLSKDDVGRPRYIVSVFYDDDSNLMPMLKYDDDWKIADLD